MTPLVTRWIKFSAVGVLGIGVQMGCFALLSGALHWNYLIATPIAVEMAVLHNFAWHERYTWKDLPRGETRDMLLRLARFHAGNGVVSILGNMALMALFVGSMGMNRYVATGAAIAICAVLNFAVSDRFVFRRP